MAKVQVYCAVSLDGFIAGEGDDLSWLGEPEPEPAREPGTVGFAEFMAQTGAMLMGRRTFDVVKGFGGEWAYGGVPVFVATTRALGEAPATVSAVRGGIDALCERAKAVAGEKNVYVDGGALITQALDAGCVDELILTVVPVLLGRGTALYQGTRLQRFDAEPLGRFGTMMQTRLTRAG
ncbi:MAG: dihydrofolate reductase family protein [Myxococcota bacterium]